MINRRLPHNETLTRCGVLHTPSPIATRPHAAFTALKTTALAPFTHLRALATAQPDPAVGTRAVNPERLELLVELCVAFRLMAEDAGALPQDNARVSPRS